MEGVPDPADLTGNVGDAGAGTQLAQWVDDGGNDRQWTLVSAGGAGTVQASSTSANQLWSVGS